MGSKTRIEWAHHTFNPWWGCEKPLVQIGGKQVVSPECVNCYAEAWDRRCGGSNWGRLAPRKLPSEKYWGEPLKWNAIAQAEGVRKRVFCASMGDILEDRIDLDTPRHWLWPLIRETECLDWLLLTKRHNKLEQMVPEQVWQLRNVWPGVTAGNQDMLNLRAPALYSLKVKFPYLTTFVSYEPALGPLDFGTIRWREDDLDLRWNAMSGQEIILNSQSVDAVQGPGEGVPRIDWVIAGGESGPGARPTHPDWFLSVRDQCQQADVPFFFKQWGEWAPVHQTQCSVAPRGRGCHRDSNIHRFDNCIVQRLGKASTGRLLDGVEHNGFPRAANA